MVITGRLYDSGSYVRKSDQQRVFQANIEQVNMSLGEGVSPSDLPALGSEVTVIATARMFDRNPSFTITGVVKTPKN